MEHLTLVLVRLCSALIVPRRDRGDRDERGDVPGWVLVTVMTVGLVMVIWQVAEGQLQTMLTNALNKVK